MKKLRYTKSDAVHHIWMDGDLEKQVEPYEAYLHFPGGQVGVSRCTDGSYWVHFDLCDVADPNSGAVVKVGCVVDSRIDCKGMSTAMADKGDLCRDDLQHVAFRISAI